MPITTPADRIESYNGDEDHFAHVLEHLFAPAVAQAGFELIRPNGSGADLIQAEIVRNLESADVVLCDISTLNPNVFFELGIRTSLDRPVCLVRDDHTPTIPFDTGMVNCHEYRASLSPWHLEDDITALAAHLSASIERAHGRNSLWRYFGLTQRGNDAINAAIEDPQQAGLKVILDEVRQLRASVEPPTPDEYAPSLPMRRKRSPPPNLDHLLSVAEPHGPRAMELVERAARIAWEISARLSITEITDQSVVFDLTKFRLSGTRPARIYQAGKELGIDVTITRNGSSDVEALTS
ncbi:MAG: hypothetical protein ABW167_04520 [Baekduia sp.]